MRDKPEEERDPCAQHQAGDDWEVKRGSFTAMDDITRQTAQAKREAAGEIESGSDCRKYGGQDQERAA